MTSGAIAEPSRPDIMKGRRLNSRHPWCHAVALQAQLHNLGTTQHPGINGAMRFVASLTAIYQTWRMLKHKGALLIGMAGKTALFRADCQTPQGAIVFRVRTMAVAAHESTLEHRVMKGLPEIGAGRRVTAGTQVLLLLFEQPKVRWGGMHLVTSHTGDTVSSVG